MKGILAGALLMAIVLVVDLVIHFWPLLIATVVLAVIVGAANRRHRRHAAIETDDNVIALPVAAPCPDAATDGRPQLRLVQGGLA